MLFFKLHLNIKTSVVRKNNKEQQLLTYSIHTKR